MAVQPIKSIPVGSREDSSVRLVAYQSGTIRKTSMDATNWTIIWLICGLVSQIAVKMARSGQWGSGQVPLTRSVVGYSQDRINRIQAV